jgi:hypothetical protein
MNVRTFAVYAFLATYSIALGAETDRRHILLAQSADGKTLPFSDAVQVGIPCTSVASSASISRQVSLVRRQEWKHDSSWSSLGRRLRRRE